MQSPIYTTVRAFASKGDNDRFWAWVKSVVVAEEYGYLIFILRENTIREMVGVTDATKLMQLSARLDTLQIIDRYLHQGMTEHENEIRRNQANPER
jgi:hypothetical protein